MLSIDETIAKSNVYSGRFKVNNYKEIQLGTSHILLSYFMLLDVVSRPVASEMSNKKLIGTPLQNWSSDDCAWWFKDQGYPANAKVDPSSLDGATLAELVRTKVCCSLPQFCGSGIFCGGLVCES